MTPQGGPAAALTAAPTAAFPAAFPTAVHRDSRFVASLECHLDAPLSRLLTIRPL